jgi:hypothetical protein
MTPLKRKWATKPIFGTQIDWGHPLSRGLVARWLFSEGAGGKYFDSARNSVGTASGGVTRDKDSAIFDGVDGTKIDCGSKAVLQSGGAGTFVIRVKWNSLTSYKTLVSNGSMAGAENNGINIYMLSGKVAASFNNGTTGHLVVSGNTVITSGIWYYLVITWDESLVKIYLNGISDVTPTSQTIQPTPGYNFTIGADGNGTTGAVFDGSISEVSVYNRAISQEEAIQLYRSPYANFVEPGILWSLQSAAAGGPVPLVKWGRVKPVIGTEVNWGHPLSNKLVGCWLFNENGGRRVHDVARRQHADFQYTTDDATWINGRNGAGLRNGTGSTSWLEVGDAPALRITGPITVCARVKFTASQSNVIIAGRWGSDESYILGVSYINPNQLFFGIRVSEVTKAAFTSNTYNDGLWHDVVGVFDGANVRIYLDGGAESIVGDATTGPIDTASGAKVVFGNYNAGGGRFDGDFDEVRIYDRALSSSEVRQLYTTPFANFAEPRKLWVSSVTPSTPFIPGGTIPRVKWGAIKPPSGTQINLGHPLSRGLLAFWAINEESGTTLFDSAGRRHGSMLNVGNQIFRTHGKYGRKISLDSSFYGSYNDFGVHTAFDLTDNFTVFGAIKTAAGSGPYSSILGRFSNSTQLGWALVMYGGYPKIAILADASVIPADNTYASGDEIFAVMRIKNGVADLFIDGVKQAASGSSVTITASATRKLISDTLYEDAPIFYANHDSHVLGIYNRPLADSEIIALTHAPFSMFEEPRRLWSSSNPSVTVEEIAFSYLRPVSDVSTGTWTTSPLYAKIDETIADDNDYISSVDVPVNDTCEIALTPTGTPSSRDNHSVSYRIGKSNNSATQLDLTVGLYQGNTLIKSQSHTNVPYGFVTTGFSLTTGEASTITDYSDLRIRFTANAP